MNEKEVDPSSSPAAAFGTQLRRSRKAKGLSQGELGAMINYSDTYVSYIERAKRPPTKKFAMRADEALETGGTLELMWWGIGHTAMIEGFPEFATKEAEATAIRLFALGWLPGLLQTREYAEAVEAAVVGRGTISQEQAVERVDFLVARQERLNRTPAPLVHAVLDESCIRSRVGGPDVMDRALQHLEDLAQRPNVILQVAPFHLGSHRPFILPLALLTPREGAVLGYTETLQRGFLERNIQTIAAWRNDYDRLQVEALSQAASVELIRAVRKELHP
ncbi:helix-turn-helix transcriptional regulator [Kitasatospora nipponensis]|uniref:Helix-turn-helix transcriptional regulator n=1 Tax=Kitasatospora nipponensis TaxID=258049 RepID=A0ABN1W5X5_9ACTN